MDRLPRPISPSFLGEHLKVDCSERENALNFVLGPFLCSESLSLAESFSNPSFQDKMPILHLLGGDLPSISPVTGSNFQLLLRLQQLGKPNTNTQCSKLESKILPLEIESCVTHATESHSPVRSDTKDYCNVEVKPNLLNNSKDSYFPCSQISNQTNPQFGKPLSNRHKRKRTRPLKKSEDVESQRLTHIAVERNRRKQMNNHLISLRSLMPPSFVQRGDQATIIGGAIDFVKELEQLLLSLQAQKQMQKGEECCSSASSSPFIGFFTMLQHTANSSQQSSFKYLIDGHVEGGRRDCCAGNKSVEAKIEVAIIQTHVNLKILCPRRPGLLLKAIAALEDLYLAILHLNVTSSQHSVLYSFSLKTEEGCKLGSADEIAAAVYEIFSFVDGN